MIIDTKPHPTDDDLTALALDEGNGAVRDHVDGCETCRRFVADIRALRLSLGSLDGDAPPHTIGHSLARRPPVSPRVRFFEVFLGTLLTNPAILPLIYLLYILFVYFLFNYLNEFALIE
jgi:hypothetical protein